MHNKYAGFPNFHEWAVSSVERDSNQSWHSVTWWHRTTLWCLGFQRRSLSGRPHSKAFCLSMPTGDMQPHAIASGAPVRAVWTLIPLLACMSVHVLLKIICLDAGVRTEATLQGSLASMNHKVLAQVVGVPRQQSALPTPKPHRRLTPLGRQHVLLHQRSPRLAFLYYTNTEKLRCRVSVC